jgi:hypothetical protein
MISIQKQFLFIHVPKTGGNSIQGLLKNYSEDDIVKLANHQDGVERFEVRNKRYNIEKHSTLSNYKSELDANTYQSLFKFATIRNPWDMVISFYFSPHRGVKKWNRNDFISLVDNISPLRYYICLKQVLEDASPKFGADKFNMLIGLDHDIDFMVRFEHLDHDFQVICKKIGIPFAPLVKRNTSTRAHYSHYYDDELKEIVRAKFFEEIKFGNYNFEND